MPHTMVSSSGVASMVHIVTTKSPLIPLALAQRILRYTHFLYPIVLLAIFGVAFAIHGVISAGNGPTLPPPPNVTGPGGKPLPTRRPSKAKVPQKESVSTIK